MPIRLTGMASGLDTDAMIEELVSAYSTKKDKYVKAQTKLEWKQDAWKELNKKINNFYTKQASVLRFSSAYSKKKATSTSTKATVTASSNSVNGSQTLQIHNLAKTGYLTGGVVKNVNDANQKITGSSKLSDMGVKDSYITLAVDGKEKRIDLTEDLTVDKFVAKLKDAGVNASFDEKNQRFFVSAKTSGKDGDFSLTGSSETANDALKSMGLFSVSTADINKYKAMAAMDIDAETEKRYEAKKAQYTDAETERKNLTDAIATLTKDKKSMTATKDTLDYQIAYANKSKDDRKADYEATKSRLETLNEKSEADLTAEEKEEKATLSSNIAAMDAVDKVLDNDVLVEDDINAYKQDLQQRSDNLADALQTNNDTLTKYEDILADTSDVKLNDYVAGLNTDIDAANQALKDKIKAEVTAEQASASQIVADYNSGALKESPTRISGEDAKITLNGADFESNTNNFSINGLTITANAVTDPNEKITINTETDVDGIYNMIKDFMKEYNALISEMDTLYNADSSKGYEPLTDEEKESMSDKEIEKWEQKIKDSLLRRDSTLQSVSSLMKTAMAQSFTVGGIRMSLSSFGIKTGSYLATADNERGMYHIDGDADDSLSSGSADKLREAIANDPDKVVDFFSQLTTNLYDKLSQKMRTSSLKSVNTVYNDKSMKREYDEYTDTIKKWEEKIEKIEERYRKQFSAMETALTKMQSQSSYLSNMFGM